MKINADEFGPKAQKRGAKDCNSPKNQTKKNGRTICVKPNEKTSKQQLKEKHRIVSG